MTIIVSFILEKLSLIPFQDEIHFCGFDLLVDVPVDDHHGSDTACADTPDNIHAEMSILCTLTGTDFQPFLQFLKKLLSASHMAGGAEADLDLVFPAWNHREKRIKGDNPIHLAQWKTQFKGHPSLNGFGQITGHFLYFFQHRNQGARFGPVSINNRVNLTPLFRRHVFPAYAWVFTLYILHDRSSSEQNLL
jgi:hypothetical protein